MSKNFFFVALLFAGLCVSFNSCSKDDGGGSEQQVEQQQPQPSPDPQTPEGSSDSFVMTQGSTYKLSMVNKGNGNAYFVTADDNDQISRLNALLDNGGTESVPATVIFDDAQDVRSITFSDVSYVFNKNSETNKIDVSVVQGEVSQIFQDVMDYTPTPNEARRRRAASGSFEANMNIALNNMNVMLTAVGTVNARISESGEGVLYSAVANVTAVITSLTHDTSVLITDEVVIEEATAEQFENVIKNLSEQIPSLVELAEKTLAEMEQAVAEKVEETDETADSNTETGEGTIVSGMGKLKTTLTWRYGADIDLHIFEAGFSGSHDQGIQDQGHIYYSAKTNSFTDGYLDYDNTSGYYINPENYEDNDYSRAAIENVYWNEVNNGTYYVYLHYYAQHSGEWCDGVTEGPCTVSIFVDGVGKSKTVEMTRAYNSQMLYVGKVTFPDGTIDLSTPEAAKARQMADEYMAAPSMKW